jgi:hypothetical protein
MHCPAQFNSLSRILDKKAADQQFVQEFDQQCEGNSDVDSEIFIGKFLFCAVCVQEQCTVHYEKKFTKNI